MHRTQSAEVLAEQVKGLLYYCFTTALLLLYYCFTTSGRRGALTEEVKALKYETLSYSCTGP